MTTSSGLTWLQRQESTLVSTVHASPFKAKQPRAPLENIVATHPLELVNLDYLCLEPRKGKEDTITDT